MGIHEKTRKYARHAANVKGIRIKARKACSGSAAPEGCVGIGKNGATPEPDVPWLDRSKCVTK